MDIINDVCGLSGLVMMVKDLRKYEDKSKELGWKEHDRAETQK